MGYEWQPRRFTYYCDNIFHNQSSDYAFCANLRLLLLSQQKCLKSKQACNYCDNIFHNPSSDYASFAPTWGYCYWVNTSVWRASKRAMIVRTILNVLLYQKYRYGYCHHSKVYNFLYWELFLVELQYFCVKIIRSST